MANFKYQVIIGTHSYNGKRYAAGQMFSSPRANLVSPGLKDRLKMIDSGSKEAVPVSEPLKSALTPETPVISQQNELPGPVEGVEKKEFRAKRIKGGKWAVGYYTGKDFTAITEEPLSKTEADDFLQSLL